MITVAETTLRQCEAAIVAGEFDDARKLAAGVSILTGQPAWQRAYEFVIDREEPRRYVRQSAVQLPPRIGPILHAMHDVSGKEFPNQSARGGTQIDLTDSQMPFMAWLREVAGAPILGAWSTRLQTAGAHVAHIHPRGHESHVIYVEVPDRKSGLLGLGTPGIAYMEIAPTEGLHVSFPCWLWHRVTPYRGTAPRLTLAFDTAPMENMQ